MNMMITSQTHMMSQVNKKNQNLHTIIIVFVLKHTSLTNNNDKKLTCKLEDIVLSSLSIQWKQQQRLFEPQERRRMGKQTRILEVCTFVSAAFPHLSSHNN
jgi:hypothetical protein